MSRTRALFAALTLAIAVGGTAASPSYAEMPYKAASHCQTLQNEQVERGIVDADGNAHAQCDSSFNH